MVVDLRFGVLGSELLGKSGLSGGCEVRSPAGFDQFLGPLHPESPRVSFNKISEGLRSLSFRV